MRRIAQWIMYAAPFYAVAAILLGVWGVPGWMALLPIFVVFVPAGAYLAWRR